MAKRKAGITRSIQRPFVCEEPGCNRCFTRFDHLQRHALVHDDTAPKLPCPDCGKTFLRHDMLVRHQRSVHENEKKKGKGKKSASEPMDPVASGGDASGSAAVNMDEHGPSKKAKPAHLGVSISPFSSFASSSLDAAAQASASTHTASSSSESTPFFQMMGSSSITSLLGGADGAGTSHGVSPISDKSWSSSIFGRSSYLATPVSSSTAQLHPHFHSGGTRSPSGSLVPPQDLHSAAFGAQQGMGAAAEMAHRDQSTFEQSMARNTAHFGSSFGVAQPQPWDSAILRQMGGSVDLSSMGNGPNIGTGSVSSAASVQGFPAYNLTASFPYLSDPGGALPMNIANAAALAHGAGQDIDSHFMSGTPTVPSQLMRHASDGGIGLPSTAAASQHLQQQVNSAGWQGDDWSRDAPDPVRFSGTGAPPSRESFLGWVAAQEVGSAICNNPTATSCGVIQQGATDGDTAAFSRLLAMSGAAQGQTSLNGTDAMVVPADVGSLQAGTVIGPESAAQEQSFFEGLGVAVHTNGSYGASDWPATHAETTVQKHSAFRLSDAAYHHLLAFLHRVPELQSSTLFTREDVEVYIDLYFRHSNCLLPLLHKATFSLDEASPALLAACVVMGTYFLPPQAEAAARLGARIAEMMWATIVGMDIFHPQRITLELLQALVILDTYATFCASRWLHEMADCFHSLVVTIARRNALFDSAASAVPSSRRGARSSQSPPSTSDSGPSLSNTEGSSAGGSSKPSHEGGEQSWRKWVEHEEKVRVAFAIYILDLLHAILFGHKPGLGGSLPRLLTLPAEASEWELSSATSWAARVRRGADRQNDSRRSSGPMQASGSPEREGSTSAMSQSGGSACSSQPAVEHLRYGDALRICLVDESAEGTPQIEVDKPPEDAFIHLLLLAGLVGMAYDLNHHSGPLLDRLEGSAGLQTLKQKIFVAMTRWTRLNDNVQTTAAFDTFTRSIHIAGQLSVYADIVTLQVACGVNPVLGQFVSASALSSSRAAVREWAQQSGARTAAWTALRGLALSHAGTNIDTAASCDEGATPSGGASFDAALVKDRVTYFCCIVLIAYIQLRGTVYPSSVQNVRKYQAAEFLATVAEGWTTETAFDVDAVATHLGGILHLVQSHLSATRWELGREAAAVLERAQLPSFGKD